LSHAHKPPAENPIDLATAALIRCKSGQILWQACLPRSEREDVEQTLTLLLLRRLSKYDAAQGNRDVFVRMVLRQATVNVLRYYRAAKRAGPVVSLDALLGTESGEPIESALCADPGTGDQADAAIDLTVALLALPEELRAIAQELRTHTKTEAARVLGIHRATLNERVKEIRAAFEARGLDGDL